MRDTNVTKVEVGRHRPRVEFDGAFEPADRFRQVAAPHRLEADLVVEEREDGFVLPLGRRVHQLREALPRVERIGPLMLFLLHLLEVDERVAVARVESKHLVERVERAIDEAAALVVEPEAEQDVRLFHPAEIRPLQQPLVHRNRFADLAFLAIEIAEDHVHFERVGVEACGFRKFLDREIDLIADQEIQAEDVVRRLPRAAAVDPLAVFELVSLPGLADGQTGQQRNQRRHERRIAAHASPSC